ncbi:uncharacterized protein EHS24_003513 [Apiotrichum porosum]|uniref:NmrA-like domain-containing protein n=1 Tax=Apiotrichum porosum TaxID=105984 RepID=A0A427XE78_9TREE|nr:uncharacterized protein EHS24_003513 [Apiotrichum porosum]RSH77209.1 hypothetical protein EHS24_003513 [Apiotrichum porosum]
MSRSILVTGATGKQGGAVIDALLKPPTSQAAEDSAPFDILAVTRDPSSASATRLAAKSSTIKLVKGDMDNVPALFESARAVSPNGQIWGVYSVQAVATSSAKPEDAPETKQGVAMVDEAVKAGVQTFVYSSVDRGGEERSWNNPTPVPHFKTKHLIEQHLRKAAGDKMGWTILRPVIFYDNLAPGFPTAMFLTYLRDKMGSKPMPWIATSDIGAFGAAAFRNPAKLNHRALSLGGDVFTFDDMNKTFQKVTGKPAPTTFSFLTWPLGLVKDVRLMVNWFKDEGYKVNANELREIHPGLLDFEGWLRKDSKFDKVN